METPDSVAASEREIGESAMPQRRRPGEGRDPYREVFP